MSSAGRSSNASDQNGFKKPATLGSKARSFIPMTPRSLKTPTDRRNDFARQVSDHVTLDRDHDGQPPQKRFRSNAAPKGTKLAAGYVDRTQQRSQEQGGGEIEDNQKRLKALEEMLKLQQIDQATFLSLRDEIGVGGDTYSTHLVKGLDFKLLERARRGEDVTKSESATVQEEDVVEGADVDVEEELEKALEKETKLQEVSSTKESKEDATAAQQEAQAGSTPSLTRDQLLHRLKQNRKNPTLMLETAVAALPELEPQPSLDHSRFRKLASTPKPGKRKFTETINGRRREVLVITDKQGKSKRKTRWLDPEPDRSASAKTQDLGTETWGGDLPEEVLARQRAVEATKKDEDEDDNDDIFGGITEYDPLAGIDSDEDEATKPEPDIIDSKESLEDAPERLKPGAPLKSTSKPRNYFSAASTTDNTDNTETSQSKDISNDPSILAALKRAAHIRRQEEAQTDASPSTNDNMTDEDTARNQALLKKLQQQSEQDDIDIDMGFSGDARYDDEADDGDKKQKLSEWTGVGDYGEDDEDGTEKGKKGSGVGEKRKRGGKKRKGDKNSFGDVMSVLEGRKKKD